MQALHSYHGVVVAGGETLLGFCVWIGFFAGGRVAGFASALPARLAAAGTGLAGIVVRLTCGCTLGEGLTWGGSRIKKSTRRLSARP